MTEKQITETSGSKNKLAQYKVDFIDLLKNKTNSLKLGGEFSLKSKRKSSYFINIGDLNEGFSTYGLASAYAGAIADNFKGLQNLSIYGIPEKGVPFASAVSVELHRQYGIHSSWFFTRKTGKNYGEATNLPKEQLAKSKIVGRVPSKDSNIILLDDVLTTADTKYTAIAELNGLLDNPKIVGLVIGVDRQEVGINGKSATEEFTKATGVPVVSIVKATEIQQYLAASTEEDQKQVQKMTTYIRVYGTDEAKKIVGVEPSKIMLRDTNVIPACDMKSLEEFGNLVRDTSGLDGIGGYKVGFSLGLRYGLPLVIETARKYTDKPIIYDHQKAGNDIPDTGEDFMQLNKEAKTNAVILFPFAGPETERAWIYRAQLYDALDRGLGVIVGGIMTHPAFRVSEGGFISNEGALEIYRIAIKAGVRDFVVPGTKIDEIKLVKETIEKVVDDKSIRLTYYAPGLGSGQGGEIKEVKTILGNSWNAIVGRQILNAPNADYKKAAEEVIALLLRDEENYAYAPIPR